MMSATAALADNKSDCQKGVAMIKEKLKKKQWIDVITQPGPTFRFDPARGYLPLLEDRPTIVIPASGSDFVTGMNRGRIDVATPSSASTTCVLSRSGRRPDPLSRSGPRVKARTAASSNWPPDSDGLSSRP
jgi:FMN-dependent NADH-azoreductase